jgi:hypothetical protein
VQRGDGQTIPLRSNIALDEAQMLYDLVRELQPEHVIELGLAQGISTMAMAQALEDNERGTLHVLDPRQSEVYESVGVTNLERCGLSDRVDFHETYPEEVVPGLPRAQVAFIDASHLFDFTMMDFVLVDKRLDVGGVVGFHDLWMESLRKALRYILTNRAEYRLWRPPPIPAHVARRARFGRALSAVPGAAKLLKPEVLEPTALFARQNLVLLEKTGPDTRVWLDHSQF